MLKNKKLCSMLAALILGGVLLTGCGGSDDDTGDNTDNGAAVIEADDTDLDTESTNE